ncbi:KUP/HAK/KT family potassium transporter [Pontibacter toksunensis]|uniref:KUP/HAK/KT family potassium transporter n=1 Tax=Pontibacter toksunensis TaxID=1332631 RepID=UPI003671E787
MPNPKSRAVTSAGLLIALGIIYGDIGTSPLYVMKAIIGESPISRILVFGGISCVFWTLTLQTTFKYVVLTLQADNRGEGGIFSLYTLIRRRATWLIIPAMAGGAALLADGIITPPISVSSAVEGLRLLYPDLATVPIVIAILTGIFLLQSVGTEIVGKAFGPVMFLWFAMLGSLGAVMLVHHPEILYALSPYYAYNLLVEYPGGFWLLGAVFLCTTGAEALYSDLGHCGKSNIRVSWVFVKTSLVLNYLGQGAWLMTQEGKYLETNPFYGIMPEWFLLSGIGLATVAAIIASQALISGSFTLISEATRLNLWPKVRINYPTLYKGQLYVPSINWLLWLGCVSVVLYFRESANMEAAYGLAITLAMLSTTILLSYYLLVKTRSRVAAFVFLGLYLLIEGSFLVANLIKFPHGGWVSLLIGGALLTVMYIWIRAFHIKRRLADDVRLKGYLPALRELSLDETIPKYATHLVFMTGAASPKEIESKVIYSIFQKRPKRADIYWFVHVDTTDEPFTMEYKVRIIAPDDVIRVDFRLGFRVEQRINLFFRKVVEEMVRKGEVDITSRYASLSKFNFIGDFRFVVLEKFLSYENDLPFAEQRIMEWYFFIKQFTPSEAKWFGLDTSSVKVEKVPLVIKPVAVSELKRIS